MPRKSHPLRAHARVMIALALTAGACQGSSPDPSVTPDAELEAYCAIAATPGLDSWAYDVATVCTPGEDDHAATCVASRVGSDGALTPIALAEDLAIVRALPASGGRLVLLLADSRLVLTSGDGTIERELATWANDPWISADGERVTWIGLPDGVTEWDFGVLTVVAAQTLAEGERIVLAEDDLASSPRPIPNSADVLYVSAQTGLTSFWIAGPERPATQLTNVGLDTIGEDSTPTAEGQLAWSITGELLFGALGEGDGTGEDDGVTDETEVAELWRLDVNAGEVHEVGPGAWPRVRDDGSVLALQPEGSDPCGAIYTAGGTP